MSHTPETPLQELVKWEHQFRRSAEAMKGIDQAIARGNWEAAEAMLRARTELSDTYRRLAAEEDKNTSLQIENERYRGVLGGIAADTCTCGVSLHKPCDTCIARRAMPEWPVLFCDKCGLFRPCPNGVRCTACLRGAAEQPE